MPAPGPEQPIVHLVDDDDSFRCALARLLKASRFMVEEYASAGEFILALPITGPGCLLLDLRMPGPSGLDLQNALARHANRLPIIFLTGHGDIPTSVRALKAGAVDFLTKPVQREILLAAIRNALESDATARTAHENDRALASRYEQLTPREQEVFALVVSGRMNKETAAELGMAERTVKLHRAHIMEKMGATSLAELVLFSEQLRRTDG